MTNSGKGSGGWAFADRGLNSIELERLRLTMSLFCDGALGLETLSHNGQTRPHWRQLERALAATLAGKNLENKGIIDVLIERGPKVPPYGIDVKSSRVRSDGHVLIEVSNSHRRFLQHLADQGLDPLQSDPAEVGPAVVGLVHSWHNQIGTLFGGDPHSSAYAVFVHCDRDRLEWELFWYPLDIPYAASLTWTRRGNGVIIGRNADSTTAVEWYSQSGGQLKYFPKGSDAKWRSGRFHLVLPPPQSLQELAQRAFPLLWPKS